MLFFFFCFGFLFRCELRLLSACLLFLLATHSSSPRLLFHSSSCFLCVRITGQTPHHPSTAVLGQPELNTKKREKRKKRLKNEKQKKCTRYYPEQFTYKSLVYIGSRPIRQSSPTSYRQNAEFPLLPRPDRAHGHPQSQDTPLSLQQHTHLFPATRETLLFHLLPSVYSIQSTVARLGTSKRDVGIIRDLRRHPGPFVPDVAKDSALPNPDLVAFRSLRSPTRH